MFHIMPGPIIPGPPPHGQLGQGVVAGGAAVLGAVSAARAEELSVNPSTVSAAAVWTSVFAFGNVMAVSPMSVYS